MLPKSDIMPAGTSGNLRVTSAGQKRFEFCRAVIVAFDWFLFHLLKLSGSGRLPQSEIPRHRITGFSVGVIRLFLERHTARHDDVSATLFRITMTLFSRYT